MENMEMRKWRSEEMITDSQFLWLNQIITVTIPKPLAK